MNSRVFVEATKRRGYLIVAASVPSTELNAVRKMLRGLVLPDQRRLHMKNQKESRKRSIATAIAVSGIRATVYDVARRYRNDRERRAAGVTALQPHGHIRAVVGRDRRRGSPAVTSELILADYLRTRP